MKMLEKEIECNKENIITGEYLTEKPSKIQEVHPGSILREKIDANLDSFFPSSPESKLRTKRETNFLVCEVKQNPDRSLVDIQRTKGLLQGSLNSENLKAQIFQANLIDHQEGLDY